MAQTCGRNPNPDRISPAFRIPLNDQDKTDYGYQRVNQFPLTHSESGGQQFALSRCDNIERVNSKKNNQAGNQQSHSFSPKMAKASQLNFERPQQQVLIEN
jgi:hypothetical protein